MNRATFVATVVAAVLLPFASLAQTDWPNKPIIFIVPYPPGGLNDAVARVFADRMTTELGRQVLIDKKAGAATTVASNFVAKAAPHGYTIYGGGTAGDQSHAHRQRAVRSAQNFDLVSLMSFTPFILQVNADFPAKNIAELIATVKANPGKFNIASSGIGATNHLAAELFKAQTGLKLIHVPYRGGAQAGQDVAAGNAQMMFSASLEAKPFLDSGKTRAIAISSLKRSPAFPNIPTVSEAANLPDFEAVFWQGLVVPAGTPQPIIDRLQKVIAKIAADPEMIERFKLQGVDLRSSTPAEFKDHLNKEEKRWTTLIKEQGIKPE
jgi:tripartite-type tricarboxylate transporter receptor subunit TctC